MKARTSRRRLLASLAASPLLTPPAIAAEPSPDAELLALAPVLLPLLADYHDRWERLHILCDEAEAQAGLHPRDGRDSAPWSKADQEAADAWDARDARPWRSTSPCWRLRDDLNGLTLSRIRVPMKRGAGSAPSESRSRNTKPAG